MSQIRCLHARRPSGVAVEVEIVLDPDWWTYRLEFGQETRGKRRPMVRKERVTRNGVILLDRPDVQDEADENRLTQTHLEQVTANREFRPVAEALAEVRYLHVIPQLVRHPRPSNGGRDPFGSDFLEQLATTPRKTQEARLRKINQALKVAVPQLQELKLDRDASAYLTSRASTSTGGRTPAGKARSTSRMAPCDSSGSCGRSSTARLRCSLKSRSFHSTPPSFGTSLP